MEGSVQDSIAHSQEAAFIGRSLLALATVIALAAPALVFHGPADIPADLSAEPRAKAQALRDADSHTEATDKLSETMRLILNNMEAFVRMRRPDRPRAGAAAQSFTAAVGLRGWTRSIPAWPAGRSAAPPAQAASAFRRYVVPTTLGP